MANPSFTQTRTISRSAEIDAGLRAYMNKVYALMAGAMIITGLVAYVVGMDAKALFNGQPTTLVPEGLLVSMFSSPMVYVIMFSPLAVVFGLGAMINRISAATAQMVFWGFAALMGLSISSKMRSALAIDDCITEYLADRSRNGMKNRRIRSMKTYSVPGDATPVPAHRMIAIVIWLAASTVAKSSAS